MEMQQPSRCKGTGPLLSAVGALLVWNAGASADGPPRRMHEVQIPSSLDRTLQPSRVWAPDVATRSSVPLLVFLHSWSGDWTQDNSPWLEQAVQRDWLYVHPDFRGPNERPEACGSPLARQDVLDAVWWAIENYRVDESRIYLAGVSGGGHMAMLMAGRHPEQFSAVSAWVGISDLAEWYRFHSLPNGRERYARMVAASCGGPPGASKTVDAQYRDRSPVFWLQNIGDLPLDLNAGASDGKTGSVPIHHTLRAFNAVAIAQSHPVVNEQEMEQIWRDGRLTSPQESDAVPDPTYGREIRLRRFAGTVRVTIFEGGHEGLPAAACAWLEQQSRTTSVTNDQ